VTACAYCGRGNDAGAKFCMGCGKPLGNAAAVTATATLGATRVGLGDAPPQADGTVCPFCDRWTAGRLPFCPHCGRRLTAPGSGPSCARCGVPTDPAATFCGICGAALTPAPAAPLRTRTALDRPAVSAIALVLLDEAGTPVERFERRGPEVTVGRLDGDVRFPDDPFLSPLHAKLSWELDRLVVRDLGSRNGTWVFLEAPYKLVDGDLMLIGSQVVRFRRLGYPGPHPPDVDATKRMGSLIPSADIASLTQLRSDGSARDVVQLSPGRDIQIGRARGEWIFPYDPSMSAAHVTIRSEDADFVVIDAGSRNGVAIAARGDMVVKHQSRILVGDKLLRIELATTL
jgi:pSer/pThr/pTyr-binding forkhead associated (FHA) protein